MNEMFGLTMVVHYLCGVLKFRNTCNMMYNKQNMQSSELELFHEAFHNLKASVGQVQVNIGKNGKGVPLITINGTSFHCLVKPTVRNSNVHSIVRTVEEERERTNKPIILLTDRLYPKENAILAENGVSWLDRAGNCVIEYNDLFLKISGNKHTSAVQPKETIKVAELSIKLTLFFLQYPEAVDLSYREIQEKTGVSLGMITRTFDLLKSKGFVVQTEQGRKIAMRAELIEWWQQQYNETVKPKLLVARMAFRNQEARKAWKDLPLPQGMCWGGDCGANLTDNYLSPGSFEIYTTIPSSTLIRTGMVLPDPNGEIKIYTKSWIGDDNSNVAPLLVVYADLLGSGDSRCYEAALKIKQHGR